ncbi:MAG: YlbF family regulator [Planctomycetota bacterium]|jgi:cell fate (sporulation/competence/biofilm development) regulator YlbF (YheA/YmcA/DUF963 family)
MSEMIELAERLGKAIADSPQASALRAAREELRKNAELSQLLKDFRAQAQKVAKLEGENKPIEVEDKHKLRDTQEKLAASDIFKKFTAAQVEYIDLMRKVNVALEQQLSATESD